MVRAAETGRAEITGTADAEETALSTVREARGEKGEDTAGVGEVLPAVVEVVSIMFTMFFFVLYCSSVPCSGSNLHESMTISS